MPKINDKLRIIKNEILTGAEREREIEKRYIKNGIKRKDQSQ